MRACVVLLAHVCLRWEHREKCNMLAINPFETFLGQKDTEQEQGGHSHFLKTWVGTEVVYNGQDFRLGRWTWGAPRWTQNTERPQGKASPQLVHSLQFHTPKPWEHWECLRPERPCPGAVPFCQVLQCLPAHFLLLLCLCPLRHFSALKIGCFPRLCWLRSSYSCLLQLSFSWKICFAVWLNFWWAKIPRAFYWWYGFIYIYSLQIVHSEDYSSRSSPQAGSAMKNWYSTFLFVLVA